MESQKKREKIRISQIDEVICMRREQNEEYLCGAVHIVEATIVFPVVFLVLFFIFVLANTYYVQAYMDKVAKECAVEFANDARNELVWQIEENNGYLKELELNPYQFFGVSKELEGQSNRIVKNRVNSSKATIIPSMAAYDIRDKKGGTADFVSFDTGFLSSEVKVEIHYRIRLLPLLKQYGIGTPEYVAYGSATISDSVEFIRDIDMVKDIITDFLQTPKGEELSGDVKQIIDDITKKFKKFFNFLG